MRRNSPKKPLVLLLVFVIVISTLLVVSAKNRNNVSWLDNIIHFTVKPVATFFSNVNTSIDGFFEYFQNKKELVQQVSELTYKNNLLEQKNASLSSLETENERLRQLLELREKYPEFQTTASSVIAKDGGNYSRFITIDKGEESGIKVNQPVLSQNGLVGLIFETGHGWSKIQTIVDPSTSVGCRITRTGDISITEGDNALINEGMLKLLYISKQFTILEGDIVETSGLGEIYPPGIPIGKIKEIKVSEHSNSQYATIVPTVDFSNLQEVLVITEK
ncbi:MAG: rod shape-determining protein MreC [Clostridia bacterium]|nr:rod shape-determining protein MreC [Clostridia bacterium]